MVTLYKHGIKQEGYVAVLPPGPIRLRGQAPATWLSSFSSFIQSDPTKEMLGDNQKDSAVVYEVCRGILAHLLMETVHTKDTNHCAHCIELPK